MLGLVVTSLAPGWADTPRQTACADALATGPEAVGRGAEAITRGTEAVGTGAEATEAQAATAATSTGKTRIGLIGRRRGDIAGSLSPFGGPVSAAVVLGLIQAVLRRRWTPLLWARQLELGRPR
jgi:hypothetical protein